jgi:hypothetical protein
VNRKNILCVMGVGLAIGETILFALGQRTGLEAIHVWFDMMFGASVFAFFHYRWADESRAKWEG